MHPDPWIPSHTRLRTSSASIGSAGASLHTRAWPMPEGAESGEGSSMVRAPPQPSLRNGCAR
eukprot:1359242-Pyramimonas_sp.AAC.1